MLATPDTSTPDRHAETREVSIWWAPIEGTAQEAFFDDDTQDANLLFTGGWYAGKTMTLVAKMLKLSAINNPIPGFWLVPDWSHVERTILPMIGDIDPDTGEYWFLSPTQWDYNHRTQVFTWDGGGPIQFLTAENPKAIAGPSGAFLGVDEPGSIKHEAWRNAVARVRHARATLRQKVASGTWEGLNWLADLFGDPTRPEAYKVFTMPTRENTEGLRHNPTYIDQVLDNITEAEAASFLDAKISNLTGVLAFPSFDEAVQWTPRVPPPDPALPLRLTFDFNVNPMTIGLCQIVSGPAGPELHVRDWLSEYGGATVESACLKLKDRYPGGWDSVIVYGDATGTARHVKSLKSNYQIIQETLAGWARRLELKVPTVNPPVKESTNAVNRLLKDARGNTRLWIRCTEPKRQCATRELVRSLQRTSKRSGTDDIEKKPGETHTHACLVGDTLIATEHGPIPIHAIRIGERVWTRRGLRRVTDSALTGRNAPVFRVTCSDGKILTATSNHPVFIDGKGMASLDALRYNDAIWPIERLSASTASSSADTRTRSDARSACISLRRRTIASAACVASMWKSGKRSMVRFLKGTTSIIETTIRSITPRAIYSASKAARIVVTTGSLAAEIWQPWRWAGTPLLAGTDLRQVSNSIGSWGVGAGQNVSPCGSGAISAGDGLPRSTGNGWFIDSVLRTARLHFVVRAAWITRRARAAIAGKPFNVTSTSRRCAVHGPVVTSISPAGRSDVYDLTVKDAHEFFANGILVSNSEAIRYLVAVEFPVQKPIINIGVARIERFL